MKKAKKSLNFLGWSAFSNNLFNIFTVLKDLPGVKVEYVTTVGLTTRGTTEQ